MKKTGLFIRLSLAISFVVLPFYSLAVPVKAAEMSDGTWVRAATDTITITTQTALASGDKIILTFKPDVVKASVTGCLLDAAAISPAMNATNDTATITLSGSLTAASHTFSGCDYLNTFNAASYEAHSVAINTVTAAGVAVDYGVAVNHTSNTVTVKATVPQFINMQISASTIDLGVLSTAAVATASHTLVVNTNDLDGYMIQIASDGKLNTATSQDINDITEDTTVTAGTEGYGIAVTAGAGVTENGNFNDDDTPVPQSATNFISRNASVTPGGGDTSTVAYRAAIAGTTEAGNYDQVVTYTIATQ